MNGPLKPQTPHVWCLFLRPIEPNLANTTHPKFQALKKKVLIFFPVEGCVILGQIWPAKSTGNKGQLPLFDYWKVLLIRPISCMKKALGGFVFALGGHYFSSPLGLGQKLKPKTANLFVTRELKALS